MKCMECMVLFNIYLRRIFVLEHRGNRIRDAKPKSRRKLGRGGPSLGSAEPMGRPAQGWPLWPCSSCVWPVLVLCAVFSVCCSPTLVFCLQSYSKTHGNKTKLCRFEDRGVDLLLNCQIWGHITFEGKYMEINTRK